MSSKHADNYTKESIYVNASIQKFIHCSLLLNPRALVSCCFALILFRYIPFSVRFLRRDEIAVHLKSCSQLIEARQQRNSTFPNTEDRLENSAQCSENRHSDDCIACERITRRLHSAHFSLCSLFYRFAFEWVCVQASRRICTLPMVWCGCVCERQRHNGDKTNEREIVQNASGMEKKNGERNERQ